jgi:hypothetical protein
MSVIKMGVMWAPHHRHDGQPCLTCFPNGHISSSKEAKFVTFSESSRREYLSSMFKSLYLEPVLRGEYQIPQH